MNYFTSAVLRCLSRDMGIAEGLLIARSAAEHLSEQRMKAAQRSEVRRARGSLRLNGRMVEALDIRSALCMPEHVRERRLLREEQQEDAHGLK
jgi:hypothetical protein